MSIRFYCKRCNQLLGIASRKAGSEIDCPKCGLVLVVPTEEAAAAALALGRLAPSPVVAEDLSRFVVDDDDPTAIEPASPQAGQAEQPTGRDGAGAGLLDTVPEPPAPGVPVPKDMILFPRRTFYVHGVLFVLLAAVAFGAGYWIGRGDAGFHRELEQEEAAHERMLLQGTIVYDPGTGQPAPDRSAVIVAVPEGKLPERPWSFQGVRPQDDPPPSADHATLRGIEALGGCYERAGVDGKFNLVLPREGMYRLLVVSAHAARPTDQRINADDLAAINRYFQLGEHLIGRSKYQWTVVRVDRGTNPIEIDFGLNERG
jgi:phage FluMu protein Com